MSDRRQVDSVIEHSAHVETYRVAGSRAKSQQTKMSYHHDTPPAAIVALSIHCFRLISSNVSSCLYRSGPKYSTLFDAYGFFKVHLYAQFREQFMVTGTTNCAQLSFAYVVNVGTPPILYLQCIYRRRKHSTSN